MSYTPGPWETRTIGWSSSNQVVYEIYGGKKDECICEVLGYENAILVAAAPEMAACLEMFLLEHKAGMTPTKAIIAEARALLARVKGES